MISFKYSNEVKEVNPYFSKIEKSSSIEIFFKDSHKSSKKKHDNRSDSVTLVAKDIYTNVISCLKDNGYGYIVGYEEGKAQE